VALGDPHGVAVDADGNRYVAATFWNQVLRIDPSGFVTVVAGVGGQGFSGDGGDATLAQLRFPRGVALDAAGNLYIADTSNHRIRKVDASGTISTVAGNGTGASRVMAARRRWRS
jgi:trimeric autotransporter adhesin